MFIFLFKRFKLTFDFSLKYLQRYILNQYGALMDNQTWDKEESVSKQYLRFALLETACDLGQDKCKQKAEAMFKQYVESNGTFR